MRAHAIQTAHDQIMFQHQNADGWITIAQKDHSTGRFKQFHYQPEELAQELTHWFGEDIYYSQNTFYKPQRRIDTIRQLRSLYVDLDVYTKGLTPEWVLGKLELESFGQEIPDPNMVIFSGRGLVLIWHIEPVPYKAMPLWRAVENYFIEKLKHLGADSKASDPTRIFRIAGSVNSRSGTMVRAEARHDYRYELRDLQYEYLPELTPSRLNTKKPGRKTKIVRLFNIYTLHIARAKDIAKLVELRNGDVEGNREYILFLYRYFTCCYTDDPQRALADTLDLNNEFLRPLSEREVIRATKSAEKAWKARSSKEANEIAIAKGYKGAGYNLKNAKLIEWLDITDEEQQHMSTIIDAKEKRRRKRLADKAYQETKRREEGRATMQEYNQERAQKALSKLETLQELLQNNPSISNRKVAMQMQISEAYVRKLKKQL